MSFTNGFNSISIRFRIDALVASAGCKEAYLDDDNSLLDNIVDLGVDEVQKYVDTSF